MASRRQECSICFQSFQNPKLITCHHSFCYKCLEDYVRLKLRNGYFNCPICMRRVQLPKEGVFGFQTNFYIETESGEKFSCDLCGPKSIACGRCLDCEENLCQSCCHAHEKSKLTKTHQIRDFGTLDPAVKGKIRQRKFCKDHLEEEIKLVCQDCNVLICFICKVIKHDNHASKTIDDAANEVRKKLEAKLNERKEQLRNLHVSLRKGEELDRTITEKAQTLIDQGTQIDIIEMGPDLVRRISEAISKTDPTSKLCLEAKLFSPAGIKPRYLSGTTRDSTNKSSDLEYEESSAAFYRPSRMGLIVNVKNLKEHYEASMVLSGAGDALGYKNGEWESCKSGRLIHDELKRMGGIQNVKVKLPLWMVSDDTIMHLATAEALIEWGDDTDKEKLYVNLASHYKECMNDMAGREPGATCAASCHLLNPFQPHGHCIPFSERGGGCGAAMRAVCIGLRFPR